MPSRSSACCWPADSIGPGIARAVVLALFAVTIAVLGRGPGDRRLLLSEHLEFLPTDIDLHHERFWDWRDTEVSRCLKEWRAGRAPLRLSDH